MSGKWIIRIGIITLPLTVLVDRALFWDLFGR